MNGENDSGISSGWGGALVTRSNGDRAERKSIKSSSDSSCMIGSKYTTYTLLPLVCGLSPVCFAETTFGLGLPVGWKGKVRFQHDDSISWIVVRNP
jgi:hypothetical protein